MTTFSDQMPFELQEITYYEYELDPLTATYQLYPFSASDTPATLARCLQKDLPHAIPEILPHYKANVDFMRRCLGFNPSPANETRCLALLNGRLSGALPNPGGRVSNIAVGRHYDVYQLGSFVVKIERYCGVVIYPAFELWAHRWQDLEGMLSETQTPIYRSVHTVKNARKAAFRSVTTQEFYNSRLTVQLPVEACAPTTFALLHVADILLDVQVQAWQPGPTLFAMLQRQGFFKRLAGAPPYYLNPQYVRWCSILKEDVSRFLAFDEIDHHPANFVLDEQRHKLVLVDIQQFSPFYGAQNRTLLQRVWQGW